jgi:hypothetical protein
MNIAEQLNAKGATPETILQIMNSSVYEVSGDLTPGEMLGELKSAAGDASAVDKALNDLRTTPELVSEIALLWIADAYETEETQEAVKGAIDDADREMPMLEIGALTLIALYAIYRMTPNKIQKVNRKALRRLPDGSFVQIDEEIGFDDFSQPLKGLLGIFSKADGDGKG